METAPEKIAFIIALKVLINYTFLNSMGTAKNNLLEVVKKPAFKKLY
jgi:hypothetical protein